MTIDDKARIFLSGHEPFKGCMRDVDEEVINLIRYLEDSQSISVGFLGFGGPRFKKDQGNRVYTISVDYIKHLGDEFIDYYGSLGVDVTTVDLDLELTLSRDGSSCWEYDQKLLDTAKEKLANVDAIYLGGGCILVLDKFIRDFKLKELIEQKHVLGYSAGAYEIAGKYFKIPEAGTDCIPPYHCSGEVLGCVEFKEKSEADIEYRRCTPVLIMDGLGLIDDIAVVAHSGCEPNDWRGEAGWSQRAPDDLLLRVSEHHRDTYICSMYQNGAVVAIGDERIFIEKHPIKVFLNGDQVRYS